MKNHEILLRLRRITRFNFSVLISWNPWPVARTWLVVAICHFSFFIVVIGCGESPKEKPPQSTIPKSAQKEKDYLPKKGRMDYMSSQEWRKAVFTPIQEKLTSKGNPSEGKYYYFINCATCHGVKGNGNGPTASALDPKPRDHTDGNYMNKLTDQQLFDVVEKGGPAMNKSVVMPNWGDKLTKEQIWDLVAYMRTLAKGNDK